MGVADAELAVEVRAGGVKQEVRSDEKGVMGSASYGTDVYLKLAKLGF